jgi:hypothetical protein
MLRIGSSRLVRACRPFRSDILKPRRTQCASHSSWAIDSGFVFGAGAFRSFMKGAFTPFRASALPLPVALLGFFGGMSRVEATV